MPNTTFDPLDKDLSITLSGSNLVATAGNVARDTGVRAVDGKRSGKYYFEITLTSGTGTTNVTGVGEGGAAWSTYLTNHAAGVIVEFDGTIFNDGTDTGKTLGSASAGDVICYAVDFTNAKVWARRNAGNWNGTAGDNPSTNTGGISISGIVTTYGLFFPVVVFDNGSTAVRTANFGDTSFAQSVPSGFTSGWPANTSTAGSAWNPTGNGWPNLTDGDLRVSGTPSGNAKVDSIASKASGKYYLEIFLNNLAVGDPSARFRFVGLANSSFTTSGNTTDAAVVRYSASGSGSVHINNSQIGANGLLGTPDAGHIVSVAVDFTNNKIWFRLGRNQANWLGDSSADPTTNTNGFDISGITDLPLFVVATNNADGQESIALGSSTNLKVDPDRFAAAGWTIGWPPPATTLTPAAYSDAESVYAPTVSKGSVTLSPAAYSDTESIYTPTASPGPITLSPAIYSDTEIVYAPTASPGPVSLSPAAYSDAESVYAPTATPGPVSLSPAAYSDAESVYEPLALSSIVLTPAIFNDSDSVYAPNVHSLTALTPAYFNDVDVVYAAAVTTTLKNLSTWSVAPTWQPGITETLGWLTGLLASRTGAEQRFGLRLSPRRSFEMTFQFYGTSRTWFDLFVMRAGGSPIYCPLWHDSHKLVATAIGNVLTIDSTDFAEFQDCPGVFLQGDSPFDFEIARFIGQTSTQITLGAPLSKPWPIGTRVFPLQEFTFDAQPQASGKADRTYEVRVRFRSIGGLPTSANADLPMFNGYFVLEVEPNYIEDLTYTYDRILTEFDNQTGLQNRIDINEWGVVAQQHTFFIKGRERHDWMRAFLYALRGRQIPIYVPTFMSDLELAEDSDGDTLTVKRCGYTDFSGPFRGRDGILILLRNGTPIYATVTGSALIGDGSTESLILDSSISLIPKSAVRRISFVPLCRLDQDAVEIVHHTDTSGAATVSVVFKGLTNTRSTLPPIGSSAVYNDADTFYAPEIDSPLPDLIYFEATYTNTNPTHLASPCLGIACASFNLASTNSSGVHLDNLGSNCHNSMFDSLKPAGAQKWGDPTDFIDLPTDEIFSGDTLGVAINLSLKRIWIRVANRTPNVWWGGVGTPDPVTGTLGISFSANMDDNNLFILGGSGNRKQSEGTNDSSLTLNAGASAFVAAIPAGFVPWDSSGETTWSETDNSLQLLSNADLTLTGTNYSDLNTSVANFVRSTTSKSF